MIFSSRVIFYCDFAAIYTSATRLNLTAFGRTTADFLANCDSSLSWLLQSDMVLSFPVVLPTITVLNLQFVLLALLKLTYYFMLEFQAFSLLMSLWLSFFSANLLNSYYIKSWNHLRQIAWIYLFALSLTLRFYVIPLRKYFWSQLAVCATTPYLISP